MNKTITAMPVLPPGLVRQIYYGETPGFPVQPDRIMCLAPWMRKDSTYADFHYALAIDGTTVTMDNGVVETGSPLPAEELVELGLRYGVSEIVAPDAIGDDATTAAQFRNAQMLNSPIQWMAVPQGGSRDEYLQCARQMLDDGATLFGISRFARSHTPDRHILPARIARQCEYPSQLEFHMLGMPEPSIKGWVPQWIRSVDSGAPIYFAAAGVEWAPGRERPPHDYDLDRLEVDADLAMWNIARWMMAVEHRVYLIGFDRDPKNSLVIAAEGGLEHV